VTPLAHGAHSAPAGPLVWLAAAMALGYLLMAWHRREWNVWRTVSFLAGALLLALAAPMGPWPWPGGDLRGHMAQHLVIGMFAPLLLVLGAPLTLVLRTIPRRWGRRLGRASHSGPARLLLHPVTALTLNMGGLFILYSTPLHTLTTSNTVAHHLTHAHFLAAGYLFAWVIAGPDPVPHRRSVPVRLVLLGVAIAAHAVLSQLLYAGIIGADLAPPGQRRGAAELMYYGGDIAELLLAMAMLVTLRPRGVSAARRRAPRATGGPAPAHVADR
jgi:putative membrane protein